jgi:uncharacterized protein YabN with tetrapyrrole methylase and pyrophosphatase domain
VRRHPHVFGEVKARTAEEALKSWNAVKEQERREKLQEAGEPPSLLDGIAPTLPSTLEAHELGVRAAEAGFDWPSARDVLDKVQEEVDELRRELEASGNALRAEAPPQPGEDRPRPDNAGSGSSFAGSGYNEARSRSNDARSSPKEGGSLPDDRHLRLEDELGDLLFSIGQLARHLGTDPESCLRRGNRKFRRRFQALEQELYTRGRKLGECDLVELEAVWNSVKSSENP